MAAPLGCEGSGAATNRDGVNAGDGTQAAGVAPPGSSSGAGRELESGQGVDPSASGSGDDGAGDPEDDGAALDSKAGVATTGSLDGADGTLPEDPSAVPRPVPPPDYGLLKTPLPPPEAADTVIYAVAGYEIVAVYSKPDLESPKLGFVRLGTRMKVTKKVEGGECPKGWYGMPDGGFACASKGLLVDAAKPPFLSVEPPPPRRDGPFPYDWAYVRRWNSPHWWRLPTTTELATAETERAVLEATRLGVAPPGSEDAAATGGGDGGSTPVPDGSGQAPPDGGAEGGGDEPLPPPPDPQPDPKPDPQTDPKPDLNPTADGEEPLAPPTSKLPLNPSHPWLERGFFVSVSGSTRDESRSYWQTARGAFVSQSDAYRYEPRDFAGHELTDTMTFPVGFVMNKEAVLYDLDENGKLRRGKTLPKRSFVDLREETEMGGKTYMVTEEGQLIRKDALRIPEIAPLPKGLKSWERWIDVSLDQQMLVAYEGQRPVYVTLVSTGRKGTKDEPFDTPIGRWRIYSKQVTSNMDGATAADGNYALQDVPWVMYFNGSYALHGAFWHESFGYVRSHGCVNLGPTDARWLYNWTTPFMPETWHGVNGSDANPGTTVVIHR